MFARLGLHWGASIPAFLALLFAPFPFLLYRYGAMIRKRCKYSAEALAYMKHMQAARGQGVVRDEGASKEVEDGETDTQVVTDEKSEEK